MRNSRGIIIRNAFSVFISMIMFICCLYPWNTFLAVTVSSPPVPFSVILLLLLSAFSVFALSSKSRFKALYITAGFVISFFAVASFYYKNIAPDSFYFFPVKTVKGVLNYLLLIFYIILIWHAAGRLWNEEYIRRTGRARFDTGISFFLLLFIVKLLISSKGGNILIYDKYIDWFFLYLFTGLILLSLFSDEKGGGDKTISEAFRKILIVAVFMIVVLTVSFTVLYNFAPELKEIAAAGSGVIEDAATPLESWVLIIIRFLMDFKYRKKIVESISSGNAPDISPGGPDNSLSDKIVVIFFIIIMLPLIILLLYIFIRMVIRRIIKIAGKKRSGKNRIPGFLAAVFHLIKNISDRIFLRKRIHPAVKCFRLLKLKGRIAGVFPSPAETPIEYGKRLSSAVSGFEKEIMAITGMFCEYTYGDIDPPEEMIFKARSDISRIMNPLVKKKAQS